MIALTLKNIPPRLYEQLKLLAKMRHRSLNSEIIYNLEKSVGLAVEDPTRLREQAAELRQRISKRGKLSADEIEKAINDGRP